MMCRSSNLLPLANAPYLLLPKNNKKDGSATDCFYFVSASGGTVDEHSIPALHDKRFIGCQYGWLAIIDAYCEPSLFNVLTSESISLPSIFTLPDIRPTFSLDGSLVFYWRRYKVHSDVVPFEKEPLDYLCEIVTFSKLVLSSNPSLSTGGFVVAALFNYPEYIAYTMPGLGRWKFLDYDERYVDLVFCQDGTLLGLTYLGAVYRFQLIEDGDFVKNEISSPFASVYSDNHKYLIQDSNGGFMQIWREYNYEDDTSETCEIKVLKLLTDMEGNKKWETILNLEDKAIFVGTGITNLISTKLYPMIKPNCIYFTDDCWDLLGADYLRTKMRDIGVYNMKDSAFEECCPRELRDCAWPLPIWVHLTTTVAE
ncbi:putative F-box protein At2g04810 [Carex rostrata]